MTMENQIARPYARAAFAVASEAGAIAQWTDALRLIAAAMAEPQLQAWLKSPKTTKSAAVEWLVALKPALFSEQIERFVELLAEKGRLGVAGGVLALFEAYCAKAASYARIELSLALPPQADQLEKIKTALTKRLGMSVEVETKVVPALIGGAVVKAGDIVIDGSVLGQLKRVADALEVV